MASTSPLKKKNKRGYGDAVSGNAPATGGVRAAALKLCNKILREEDELELHELTEVDAEGDNLKPYFATLATGLGSEECLKSTGEEYSGTSLGKYLDHARADVRAKFPTNQVLADDEFFANLKNNIPKLAARRMHKGLNEDDVVSKSIVPFRLCSIPCARHQKSCCKI